MSRPWTIMACCARRWNICRKPAANVLKETHQVVDASKVWVRKNTKSSAKKKAMTVPKVASAMVISMPRIKKSFLNG